MPTYDLVGGDLDLRVPERLVVVTHPGRNVGFIYRSVPPADRFRCRDRRLDLRQDLIELKIALADQYRVAFVQDRLQHRRSVDEDVVDASEKRTVFQVAVDKSEVVPISHYPRVLSRDAAIVKDDITLFSAPDRVFTPGDELRFPNAAVRLSYL